MGRRPVSASGASVACLEDAADGIQIAVADFKVYSLVLESMASIAELIYRSALVEETFLRFSAAENATSPPSATKELRRALLQLYTRILTHLALVRAYYLQNTASR